MADSTNTSGGLLGLDPQMLAYLGMGIMSAGKYGGNLGDGLMQGMQGYYQSKLAGQQLQKGQFDLARQGLMLREAQREFGGGQQQPPQAMLPPTPQAPPAPQGSAAPGMPGAIGGPATAAPQAPQQPQPSFLTPPTQADIYSTQVPGLPSAGYIRGSAVLGERNPMPELDALRAAQLKQKQQEWAPRLAKIDNIVNGKDPVKFMQSDDEMRQGWPILAQRLGYDPTNLDPKNVRAAFNYGGNVVRSALSMPTEAPKVPLQTVSGDGFQYKEDPITGKTSEIPGQITPEQRARLGMEQQRLDMAKRISEGFNGKGGELLAALTEQGVSLPAGMRSKEQQLATVNGLLDRHPDLSVDEIAAQVKAGKINFGAAQKGVNAFTSGKQGDIVRSLSVATDHLDQLKEAATALQNGNLQAANALVNAFSTQTGNPSVTNFNAMKEIVGDEVVKAVVGSTGAAGDREAIKSNFSAKSSPAQILGAIDKYKGLMGGQLSGLRRQYERATGRTDFDASVSEAAKAELPQRGGSAPSKRTYDPATGTFK